MPVKPLADQEVKGIQNLVWYKLMYLKSFFGIFYDTL